MKGLVHELLSLVAVVVGIVLAFQYGPDFSRTLSPYIKADPGVVVFIAYFMIFCGTLLVFWLISFFITKVLSILALGLVNRLLGAVFGVAKSLFFLILLLHFLKPLAYSFFQENEAIQQSLLYHKVETIEQVIAGWFPKNPENINLK